jgi:hypothetical protein
MPLLKRAGLAVLLLCLPRGASAADDTHWASDPRSGCALFDAGLKPGDAVRWSGACQDGRAEGSGTATFSNNNVPFESFTGAFTDGVAADGSVTVTWGHGWSYDGEMLHGRFDGEGILVNDSQDHFEGWWNGGKLDGMGSVIHQNGERYDGAWKNDQPNGHGILTRADGSKLEGEFRNGKFVQGTPAATTATLVSLDSKQAVQPLAKGTSDLSLSGLTGKKLLAVDGAALNLTSIEGGIERDISAANGTLEKATFIFINDRLGTVVADAGPAAAGAANVTGFFRLTDNGVEIRYADGRVEILAANNDGGVQLRLETQGASATCRSFYPAGHSFSEADKKAAVAAYASRLGLGDTRPSCQGDIAAAAPPAQPLAPDTKPHTERHTDIKHPAKFTLPKFSVGTQLAALAPVTEKVTVKDSVVHAIDAAPPAIREPQGLTVPQATASAMPSHDDSTCLKVESDGAYWGFRNACGFDVQFSYCLAQGGDSLSGCSNGGIAGSVAARGFGALLADKSFSETDADHAFRWLACGGGAGEVVAHLDRTDPPAGRCLRATDIASNDATSNPGDKK